MRKKTISTELSDENLENANGGTITALLKNGQKRYVVSDGTYNPNGLNLSKETKSFDNRDDALAYANDKGWSTYGSTYEWGKPKRSCCTEPNIWPYKESWQRKI